MEKISLDKHKKKVFSQGEEDGVTEKLFELIGTTNKFCVEFGVEDGNQCCSRILWENHGFKALMFDNRHERAKINLFRKTVTTENIIGLLEENNVPMDLDFLCVDIDSCDFYIVHTILKKYKPRLLVVETNPTFYLEDKVVAPNHHVYAGAYHGAGLRAWASSLKELEYNLVYHTPNGINAFFVSGDDLKDVVENYGDAEKLFCKHHPGIENYKPYPDSWPILTSREALDLV